MEDTTDSESEEDEKNPSEKMRKSHEKLQKVSNNTDFEDKGWKVSSNHLYLFFGSVLKFKNIYPWTIFYRAYKK